MPEIAPVEVLRTVVRWSLAVFMALTGIGHFLATEAFLGQTPDFLPFREGIILVSGAVEIAFAVALLGWPSRRRTVGTLLALFYVAVFPGNVYQAVAGTSSFGLDTPGARWTRLLFQPVLIAVALWAARGPRPGVASVEPSGAERRARGEEP